jgi:hypothetical protein
MFMRLCTIIVIVALFPLLLVACSGSDTSPPVFYYDPILKEKAMDDFEAWKLSQQGVGDTWQERVVGSGPVEQQSDGSVHIVYRVREQDTGLIIDHPCEYESWEKYQEEFYVIGVYSRKRSSREHHAREEYLAEAKVRTGFTLQKFENKLKKHGELKIAKDRHGKLKLKAGTLTVILEPHDDGYCVTDVSQGQVALDIARFFKGI